MVFNSMSAFFQLLSSIIYVIGLLVTVLYLYASFKSLISILKAILEPYFQPELPHNLIDKFGKWAVITGATDGIGKEYAKELAKQGLNVVLISRTKEKLVAVTGEIENSYKVKTKWIVADFSKGKEIYEHIRQELTGIPVSILVNNVGRMYDYPDELCKQPENLLWDIININVGAVTLMSRLLIPEMKKQGKGAIVNISSGSELQPMPLMAVYAASKRYIKSLTLAMAQELSEYNIVVQCVTPMFLVTKMNQYSATIMKGNLLIPQVQTFTRSAVFTLGKTVETTGYWSHGIQVSAFIIWKQKHASIMPQAETFFSISGIYHLITSSLYLIGLVSIALFLYDNLKSLVSISMAVLQPYFQPHLSQTLADKFGKWAVITGATDGIGRGYAKELAKRGLNIVLISRSKEKLIATANEIENLYKTKTKWIVADFSKGKEIYKHIKQELLGIPVGILVNNVGRMYDYPDELCNQPEDLLWEIININIGAVTFMSRLVIPDMKKQRKGAIVNISSGTELQPAPLVAAYAATKSYIRSLSLAMECELHEYNITVQCVVPGFVVTKMNQFSESLQQSSFFSPPAETYTRWAVFTLGKTKETTGYWTHAIAYCLIKLFPEWLRIRVGHFLSKQLRTEYLITQAKRKIM
ncbi:hypothetical protein GQX74_010514 [Glossina fuscipes]|nr:hypothetical protein GQX74_010514 [Glossina fuscipes]